MNEASFKRYIKNGLKMRAKVQHIESPYTALGIPDTFFSMSNKVAGWIEFKFMKSFPKRKTTVIKLTNVTKEQKLWILVHGRLNRRTFLFLKVGKDEYLLYDCYSTQKIGNLTADGMLRYALAYWHGRVNFEELELALRNGY